MPWNLVFFVEFPSGSEEASRAVVGNLFQRVSSPRKSTSVGGSAMLANGASLSTICMLLFCTEEEEDESAVVEVVVIVFRSLLRHFVDAGKRRNG